MNFKAMLRVFPADKLAHYQWASWFSTAAAVIAVLFAMIALHSSPASAALAGVVASVGTALAAGKMGERSDRLANAKAAAAGEPPPHEVSTSDVLASLLGCIPSAVPLLVLFIATHARSAS